MRGDLTDEEWAIIGGLLLPERGRWSRPAQDNRLFLNGMLYVLRVGAHGGTCMSATENGTRSMCGSVDGQNRVSGTLCWKRWLNSV